MPSAASTKPNRVPALGAAIAVPFLYFGNLLVSSMLYPGYSQMRQQVSELGANGSPHPMIFNVGVMITGLALVVGAFGFLHALKTMGAPAGLGWLVFLVLLLFAVTTLMAAVFPLPDARHGGKFLGLVILLGPPLLAAALWKRTEAKMLNIYLLATTLLMIAIFSTQMGAGHVVTGENAGLIQRITALVGLTWIAIAAVVLNRLVASPSHTEPTPTE